MGVFRYLYQKVLAVIFRLTIRWKFIKKATPDTVLWISSRQPNREIRANVYMPSISTATPGPVLINLHGSGFMIPLHGSDDAFCRQISTNTAYTVVDIQYRLAPEHPFPAALEDVEDVVRYTQLDPGKFDPQRIAISGFSAGGTLALSAASSFLPRDTFETVIAYYPVTDLHSAYSLRSPPDPLRVSPSSFFRNLFRDSHVPQGVNLQDPRISPLFAEPDAFPTNVLVVTAARDGWALEAEELAEMVKKERRHGKGVICRRMADCAHGWDKGGDGMCPKEKVQIEALNEAYRLAEVVLRS